MQQGGGKGALRGEDRRQGAQEEEEQGGGDRDRRQARHHKQAGQEGGGGASGPAGRDRLGGRESHEADHAADRDDTGAGRLARGDSGGRWAMYDGREGDAVAAAAAAEAATGDPAAAHKSGRSVRSAVVASGAAAAAARGGSRPQQLRSRSPARDVRRIGGASRRRSRSPPLHSRPRSVSPRAGRQRGRVSPARRDRSSSPDDRVQRHRSAAGTHGDAGRKGVWSRLGDASQGTREDGRGDNGGPKRSTSPDTRRARRSRSPEDAEGRRRGRRTSASRSPAPVVAKGRSSRGTARVSSGSDKSGRKSGSGTQSGDGSDSRSSGPSSSSSSSGRSSPSR